MCRSCYHLDVEEEEDLYATLQSLRTWRYNLDNMPANWSQAVLWEGKQDDEQREGDYCVTEWDWWVENGMSDHAGTSGVARATATIG
jgi:hypothetical protein